MRTERPFLSNSD